MVYLFVQTRVYVSQKLKSLISLLLSPSLSFTLLLSFLFSCPPFPLVFLPSLLVSFVRTRESHPRHSTETLPLSGTLGPAVKFKNQQEFLLTAHTTPARQTTGEEGPQGEGSSHVGYFGGFRPEIIHEKGNQSICTTNFRGACRNRKSLVLYHILRGAPLAPE